MIKKYKNYIKSSDDLKNFFGKFNGYTFKNKIAIKKIKIDTKSLNFDNSVDMDDVNYMFTNFDEYLWQPITVDKNYYLLDGKHRLALAEKMGLKYIDVMIEDKDKIEYSKEPVKFKKMTMKELINL